MIKHIPSLVFCVLLSACNGGRSVKDIKADYGPFQQQTIKTLPVDYTKTPIYSRIQHHPENFEYLDKVDIHSIGHISDSLFITGFMVTPKAPGKYPVVVYNRGGNRDLGSLIVANAVEVMAPLAAQGYVVVASNYRGTSYSEGADEFGGNDVNDVLNLIRSMGEIEMADTSRVGLLGISRGGMMNYLALKGRQHSNIKAVVTIGGISDLEITIQHHPEIGDVVSELVPAYKSNREQVIQSRSAVHWANQLPTDVPLLIMHSKTDAHVDYSQVSPFATALNQAGIPHELVVYEDDTHGLTGHRDEVQAKVLSWFNTHLKP